MSDYLNILIIIFVKVSYNIKEQKMGLEIP